jgi:YVTN family beta-propeller protein
MTTPPPLEGEGEAFVYLRPLPRDAGKLSFTLGALSARKADGTEYPLTLAATGFTAGERTNDAFVASGRLPPGDYEGFVLQLARASVASGSKNELRVPTEPTRLPFRFTVARRRAVVVTLTLDQGASLRNPGEFTPSFLAGVPARTSWQLAGYTSNTGSTTLTAFDRRARVVTGVVPTGREPRGMALETRGNRLYVAVSGDDAIDIVDVAAGEAVSRINLGGNDRPRDLAFVGDGKLLVVNSGTRSASFVDPGSTQELARVPVGEEPWSLLVDPVRARAYVLNRRSNSISIVDVAARSVVGSIPTDPEPLWAQANGAGTRLYLICAGSAFLTVFSLPDLSVIRRVHIGLGASALKVDPRTDQIYVGMVGEGRIYVYDPRAFLPIDDFEVPDSVSFMAIDEVDNTLFALVPSLGKVAVIDLTSRKIVALLDVGSDPYQVIVGSRRN